MSISAQVFKHTLGSDPKDDELVFHETDDSFYVGLGESRSREYICVSSGAHSLPIVLPCPPTHFDLVTAPTGCAHAKSLINAVHKAPAQCSPAISCACIAARRDILCSKSWNRSVFYGPLECGCMLQAQPSHQRCVSWRQASPTRNGRWSSRARRMWSMRLPTEGTICSSCCGTLSAPTQSSSSRPLQTPPRPQ